MSEREEVKRYGFYGDYGYCRCRIEEFDDGDFVSYDDYAALRSQLAEVERERENVSSQLWDCTNERDGYKHRAERMARVVEAANAYLTEWDSDSYESVAHVALINAVRAFDAEAQP